MAMAKDVGVVVDVVVDGGFDVNLYLNMVKVDVQERIKTSLTLCGTGRGLTACQVGTLRPSWAMVICLGVKRPAVVRWPLHQWDGAGDRLVQAALRLCRFGRVR
jgi:hypothetical protein